MEQALREQLDQWHRDDQFQQIIDTLENIEEQDYDTISQLARAYNNRGMDGDYDRAVQLLLMIADMGLNDPLWHYRIGYAYYFGGHLLEAEQAFRRVLELDPEDEDSLYFLNLCREHFFGPMSEDSEILQPEVYDEEEIDLIEDFIMDNFGEFESVFHEILSPDIHVDICLIPPDDERNFYTLVTMGMGAHRMNVPEELQPYGLERAELVLCLPADWHLHSDEEKWYWPIRLMKILARLPIQEDTWLGWGHTIDHGEAFDSGTELCGCMLINPACFGLGDFVCVLPDGEEVNFYQILPLYREEMEFKMEFGAEELLGQLDGSVLVVDPKRQRFSSDRMLS